MYVIAHVWSEEELASKGAHLGHAGVRTVKLINESRLSRSRDNESFSHNKEIIFDPQIVPNCLEQAQSGWTVDILPDVFTHSRVFTFNIVPDDGEGGIILEDPENCDLSLRIGWKVRSMAQSILNC